MFAVPDVKGLGLIELPTNSIYVLQKAYSAMQTVALARGRLTGTRFWLSKKEFDITRIDDSGQAVRQKQMLTVLDADIDLGALLDGADEAQPALDAASRAVALLESDGRSVDRRSASSARAAAVGVTNGQAMAHHRSFTTKITAMGAATTTCPIRTRRWRTSVTACRTCCIVWA